MDISHHDPWLTRGTACHFAREKGEQRTTNHMRTCIPIIHPSMSPRTLSLQEGRKEGSGFTHRLPVPFSSHLTSSHPFSYFLYWLIPLKGFKSQVNWMQAPERGGKEGVDMPHPFSLFYTTKLWKNRKKAQLCCSRHNFVKFYPIGGMDSGF